MPFSPLVRHSLVIALAALLHLPSGCRALRCTKTSDEAIAATRRLSLQGIDAQERGQFEKADVLFAAAVSKCPQDERARCGYAESLWRRGAHAEAITHMEEAVRLSGHDPLRIVQLGQMYRQQGDLPRALEQAERAIAANAQLATAWALQGDVQSAQGNRSAALASYHRALSYQTHYPEVQLALAEIYLQENRPQRSLATLQAVAAGFPAGQVPTPVLINQGLAFRNLGRAHDASRAFAQAAQRGNPTADLLFELARAQAASGETAAARAALAAALQRAPGHAACLALAKELGDPSGVVIAANHTPSN